ncbi:2-oxoglutarate dehydrogenase E2 component [Desulfuromusa kysingii]|uniref:Dihydrolipoyllysine-residue succinyltransferase component of 2-oxoglutarate dehydrogenase complex n=1 Tax=Desulfuromusa kysingii TaxID=37625 RepID=A0A1H3X8E1_9BACT|nr:2-oxoglutarate dehydrogenase complex dihydrolipoyllysine-residue succinyltransferase [Desulfuromusa kysingii]SDZ95685.1 2-oxoglutarate dehydrogenase E2 component [Desulfuromusa kysingii]
MDIIVPQVGESIVEAEIGEWFKKDGEYVNKDDLLLELETEKVNVELNADASGKLTILVEQGEIIKIGAVVGKIDETATAPGDAEQAAGPKEEAVAAAPVVAKVAVMNPAVPKLAAERGIDPATLKGSGRDGRILVDDIPAAKAPEPKTTSVAPQTAPAAQPVTTTDKTERTTRVAMSQFRKKMAEHLLRATQETAMLTTFNEVDMSRVMELRRRYKETFLAKHDVGLGFMSFFIKACAEALKDAPEVNASIDGNDIVYHNYYDIGVAVGSKRGLVVPVIRDADQLDFAGVEKTIRDLAVRAGEGKLTLDELQGGTFTVSNGGVYGSVLSTPLLNPPQCGILGMHGIQERAVVVDGEVVIRPMMNIALSYDHRIIDGKQAVGFLKQVKNYIDNPETLLLKI